MERLTNLVRGLRKRNHEQLEKMAEDYISKAYDVLKKYFEKEPLAANYYSVIGVEILDIDIDEGTVEIGAPRFVEKDEECLYSSLEMTTEHLGEVFKREKDMDPEYVNIFAGILNERGFKCFYVPALAHYNDVVALCPCMIF